MYNLERDITLLSPLVRVGQSAEGIPLLDWSTPIRLGVKRGPTLAHPVLSVSVATVTQWVGVPGAEVRVRGSIGETTMPLPCRRVSIERVQASLVGVVDDVTVQQELEITIEGVGADGTSFIASHIEDEFFPGMKSQVQGVSYPRSGHHMLEDVLRGYFDCRFRYCERYNTCGQRPCVDPHTTLQKDHDFLSTVPTDGPSDYLIQYRHPLYSIPSHYEHEFRDGTYRCRPEKRQFRNGIRPGDPESREAWLTYAVHELELWKKWVTKWVIDNDNPRAFYLPYEDVMRDPAGRLADVISFLCPGHVVDETRLGRIITNMCRHTPRKLSAFKHYDESFFRSLERRAADEIDAVGLERVLDEARQSQVA